MGDSTSTWTNPKTHAYWPALLTNDPAFAENDIYVYEYPTAMISTSFSIDEIAENMRLQFASDKVSDHRHLIFIAHSMGGIAVRAYLLKYRQIADKVAFIYFFSTPTTGSEIANLGSLLSHNPQFRKVVPMRSEDYLADVQRQWLAADFHISTYCAYERQPTFGVNVVTQASAASLCTKRLDPIDTNHIDISKPSSEHDTPYLAFKGAYLEQAPHIKQTNARHTFVLTAIDTTSFEYFSSPSFNDKARHFLNIRGKLKFESDNFNTSSYLSSLRDIEVKQASPHIKFSFVNIAPIPGGFEPQTDGIHFELSLQLEAKPEPRDFFELKTGPQKWAIRFVELTWTKKEDDRGVWWIAGAEMRLTMEDPNWAVVKAARSFPARKGEQNAQAGSLIEITIENRYDQPLAVDAVTLHAEREKTYACYCPGCISAPPQPLVIDWQRLIAHDETGSTDPVSTTMATTTIPVSATYREESCFNPMDFNADIPVQVEFMPHEAGRIIFKTTELPSPSLPSSLYFWNEVAVSIKSDPAVFPNQTLVIPTPSAQRRPIGAP